MLLQGLFVPLSCPFYRDGESYLRKLEGNVRRYSLGPAAGLIALPPEGESAGLTDAERRQFLRSVAEAATPEKVLLAGVRQGSVRAALEEAAAAQEAGFDAILLAPPVGAEGLAGSTDLAQVLLFFQAVADASPLPLVLWNDPFGAAFRFSVQTLADLAHTPGVIGCTDGALTPETVRFLLDATSGVRRQVETTTVFEAVTGRMRSAAAAKPLPQGLVTIGASTELSSTAVVTPEVLAPSLKTRSRTVGFQLISANRASGTLPLLHAGCAAFAPSLATCAPQGCFEVYAAWKDGDTALAEQRAARLAAADGLLEELGPAGVKYACDWNGFYGGQPRLPRVPLTADQRMAVERALGEVRN